MSRRKQSNPKPLKRKAEEELEELAESLQLPSEVLGLREAGELSPELSVYARVMLRGGTLFGPYAAHLVKDPGHPVSTAHITIRNKEGSATYLKLKEAAGSWLKTLRLVQEKDNANASLSLEGDEVWCNLTRDIAADTELLAHFTASSSSSSQDKQMSPSVETAAEAEALGDDVDVVVDDADGAEFASSAAEELKNVSKSPQIAMSSPAVSVVCNGPDVPVANDDDGQKMSEGLDDTSDRAEALQSPSQVTSQSTELAPVQVKQEVCSPAAVTSGHSSEDLASDDPDGDPSAMKNDQLAAVASKSAELRPVNGYSPLACASPSMLLQRPTIVLQQAFECGMCGIQFSSGKTLKAHQTYYCARRGDKAAFVLARPHMELVAEGCPPPVSPGQRSSPRENGEAGVEPCTVPAKRPRREDGSSPPSSDASSTTSKSPKSGRTYQCKYCSYAYDRKGSLTRHMRLHGSPSSPTSAAEVPSVIAAEDISVPPSARYCANCDIQFSSYKTFTVHKQFYCGTRHVQKAPVSIAPAPAPVSTVSIAPAAPEQVLLNQPLFAAISTNPLILVPCSYVPGNGLVPTTGGVLRQDPAPSLATPAIACPQAVAVAPPAAVATSSSPATPASSAPACESRENGTLSKEPSTEGATASRSEANSPSVKQEQGTETPLDLSLRKEAKGGVSPRNPASPTAVQQEDASNASAVVVSSMDTLLTLGEQVVVKQGTSRCRECNIVFYKHENYLAHKRHYCASRQHKLGQLSSPSGDEGSSSELASQSPSANASPAPPLPDVFAQRSAGVQSPPQPLYQFYCLACGIKFTSLSNLQAHQTYYCPKRDVLKGQVGVAAVTRPAEFSCTRCRLSYPTDEALKQHLCSAALRKCPYCDVFCPTQIAAQRHLVTHTGVRAFRCAACGYKGHTLRGMRTHVRMHLEKGTQLQEEALILCVGADGNTLCPWNGAAAPAPVTPLLPRAHEASEETSARSGSPPTATAVTEESNASSRTCEEHHTAPTELLHWCNLCGYSSSYKGNVVRHVKLVHRDVVATSAVHSFTSERPRSSIAEGQHSPVVEVKAEEVSDAEDAPPTEASQHSEVVACVSPAAIDASVVGDVAATGPGGEVDTTSAIKPVPSVPTPKSKVPGGTKYCKTCDISFNYLSTFVAHKKYYCTSQTPDSVDNPSAVTDVEESAPGTA